MCPGAVSAVFKMISDDDVTAVAVFICKAENLAGVYNIIFNNQIVALTLNNRFLAMLRIRHLCETIPAVLIVW